METLEDNIWCKKAQDEPGTQTLPADSNWFLLPKVQVYVFALDASFKTLTYLELDPLQDSR